MSCTEKGGNIFKIILGYPVHPFLFCIYSVLYLYVYNINQTSLSVIFIPMMVILFLCCLVLLFTNFLLKDKIKAGIVTFLLCLGFFTFGHLHEILVVHFEISPGVFKPIYLFYPYIVILASAIFFISKTCLKLSNINLILNYMTILMALLLSAQTFYAKISWHKKAPQAQSTTLPMEGNSSFTKNLPDIYYIITDAYPSENVLREKYGFDNSEFVNYLRGKGFKISPDSKSNYGHTEISLASSLNCEYVNYLAKTTDINKQDWELLRRKIQNSSLIQFLKSSGYSIINISSIYGPLNTLKLADQNILDPPGFNEFSQILLYTTMIKAFYEFNMKRERILTIFKTIEDLTDTKSPKFVITHLDSPHPPSVFDRNGKLPKNRPRVWISWERFDKNDFIEELIYLNTKFIHLIDRLISRSETPPVILLQADHGPALIPPHGSFHSYDPPIGFLEERFGILNAMLLPKSCQNPANAFTTPVNSFRIILNCLFKTSMPMLEDRMYWSKHSKPYKFNDVTDKLKKASPR